MMLKLSLLKTAVGLITGLGALALFQSPASAAEVWIDPSNYSGKFEINPKNGTCRVPCHGPFKGAGRPIRLNLPDGTYRIKLYHSAEHEFGVASGRPFCKEEYRGLACRGNSVRFRTTRLWIWPLRYKGKYEILNSEAGNRPRNVVVLKDQSGDQYDTGHQFKIEHSHGFQFNTDPRGWVRRHSHYPRSARVFWKLLVVRTVGIHIEPSDPSISWWIANVEKGNRLGARTVRLIPGTKGHYRILVSGSRDCGHGQTRCAFSIDQNGNPAPSEMQFSHRGKRVTIKLHRR